MSGVVDPDTLYTKQNCIGISSPPFPECGPDAYFVTSFRRWQFWQGL